MLRRTLICLSLAAAACKPPATSTAEPQPPASEAPSVDAKSISKRFFDAWLPRSPVTATALGHHAHDGEWPDLSSEARARNLAWGEALRAEIEAALSDEAAPISASDRVDLHILLDQLRLGVISETHERTWATDPLAYAYLVGAGLDDLISRDYAPLPQRAASLAERLEGLPALLEQAQANLSDPAAIKLPHARVAQSQFRGVVALIDGEIPNRVAEAPPEVRERISKASKPARAAIERFIETVLSDTAIAQAAGPWRIGSEVFAEKLGATLGTRRDATDVLAAARAEHARVRAQMEAIAVELHEPLYGKPAPEEARSGGEPARELVRNVLRDLATFRPTAESLRDDCEANLATIDAFVRAKNLIPMDPEEVLEVIWTPEHERGVAIAGLDPAPPLDERAGLASFYLVQPVPDAWTDEVRDSFLREYNGFMLEVLSIHEAIPGHFVQLYYSRRDDSKVRRVFNNGPFVEGWAVYTEQLMVEHGYPGVAPEKTAKRKPRGIAGRVWELRQTPELRAKAIALNRAKFYLRAVTNAILDHEIHAGDMTEAEALALMMEESFQEEGEARGKWTRAQVTSAQLSTYFVGAVEWNELRDQARQRAEDSGEPFDLSRFHAEALAHGAPPVSALPSLMGW
jgi:uncharacterized protein (DUF885 family)